MQRVNYRRGAGCLGPSGAMLGVALAAALLATTLAATVLAVVMLPQSAPRAATPVPGLAAFARSLRNPVLLRFLAIAFLHLAGFAGYYAFYTLYLRLHGYDATLIGLYWAFGVVAEIAMFAVGPRLLRLFRLEVLLRMALAGTCLRWVLVAGRPDSRIAMFAAQSLHLLGFGLFHTVAVLLAPRLLPAGGPARAQALVAVAGWGAGGFVGLGGRTPILPAWTWHANAFASCMLTLGSATSEVRSLALPPTTSPANAQWKGRPIWCTVRPSISKGRNRRVTIARAAMRPRADSTVTQPPCSMPRSAASSGLSSTNISGCSSLSQLLKRLIGPLR